MTTYTALFNLGRIVATPYAKEELERLNYSPLNLLRKHMSGDWSESEYPDENEVENDYYYEPDEDDDEDLNAECVW